MLSCVLFGTPWTACSMSGSSVLCCLLAFAQSMSFELVMRSCRLILCCPLLLSVLPSIRVFSNELALQIRWSKYCLLSIYPGLIHGQCSRLTFGGFPDSSAGKESTRNVGDLGWETWSSLGWENPLEKGKATYSSILTWRIPWIV